jgi:cell division protease FtsH
MIKNADPRTTSWNVGYWLLAMLALLWMQSAWQTARTVEPVPYSQFEQALADGRVAEVVVGETTVTGKLKAPDPGGKTVIVANRVEPTWPSGCRSTTCPAWSRARCCATCSPGWRRRWCSSACGSSSSGACADKQGWGLGGFMSIGKSRAKVYVEKRHRVTFADVAGVDEAKAELQEIVEFLKDPQGYGRLGARMPKGVLLVGPAGHRQDAAGQGGGRRGRRALLLHQRLEFVEMFVGVGAARVRDLFEQARAKAPAIIFIDELDALGRARGAGRPGRPRRAEQTLNQLLAELDGFDPRGPGAAGGHQPARDPRPGAAARRPLRPPGAGRPARQAPAACRSCRCT